MKKVISIGVCFVLSLCILTGCQKEKETNNNQDNIENNNKIDNLVLENKDVLGTQIVEQITFEITSLTYENDVSILKYSIMNNSENNILIPNYKMIIKVGENNIYILKMNYKDKILKPNKTIKVKKEIKKDLTKATSINFELIEEENR